MNVRNRLKAAIVARLTDAGVNTERNRFRAVEPDSEFPIVFVYSKFDEAIPAQDIETYELKPTVIIVALCQGDTADDDLDELCGQIEDALIRPMAPLVDSDGAVVSFFRLRQTEIETFSREHRILLATMEWEGHGLFDVPTDP